MIREIRTAGVAAALVALAGCSSINQFLGREDAIDYKSATSPRASLSVPPDLTQVPENTRFSVPPAPGATSYSDYASDQARRQAMAGDRSASSVLPQMDNIRLNRDGENRWLTVDMSAVEVFNKALDFWRDEGFSIRSQDAQAGLIETDWAENRAKIPQDFIRRTLGKVFDQAWDSGMRDMFRTRLERGANGAIEVYFTHQHMEEELIGESQSRWVPKPSDPDLDAAMLARFMVYLGAAEDQAEAQLARASAAPQEAAAQTVRGSGSEGMLEISEPFDRAWRRVGLALDRGNFTVEDRDRAAGQYFVRYVDVDALKEEEKKGFFARMFGSSEPKPHPQYRVQLNESAGVTRVTVLNADGQPDNSPTAGRILDVLMQQLRD